MNKKCPNCNLVNFLQAEECQRCEHIFTTVEFTQTNSGGKKTLLSKFIWRASICFVVCLASILGFYLSLIFTSSPLSKDEKAEVNKAIQVLGNKGFSSEVFLLKYLTSFRSNDNWLNASVEKENAYAATNYPFEIMTIYPDFFKYPVDDTERAAILLHEAKHLQGADEKDAYTFVWKNRYKLGWTKENYINSLVWQNVRKQTKEINPELFLCPDKIYNDCTEF